MIAFLASFLVVAYLLIPRVLFRLVLSFFIPLKKFDRTRGEEITFAVVVALLPLILAAVLVWHSVWFSRHPFEPRATEVVNDYKLVFAASYSEQVFRDDQVAFWYSLGRTWRHQLTLLTWYYAVLILEAFILGFFSAAYGRFHKRFALYRRVAEKILLPSISEWHVLLTPFAFSLTRSRT